jgi:16S rRNA (uracil1498-N3)-methyltransferase
MRLFLRDAPWENGTLLLNRDIKKRLIRVMRMKQGDQLEVAIPGHRWVCTIEEVLTDGVLLRMLKMLPVEAASKTKLILGQAIPKGERFEWLIQKATELGISEIYPLITDRTIVRPENIDKKLQRWNEIAMSAAEQSENANPLTVWPPKTIQAFLERPLDGLKIMLHERQGAKSLKELLTDPKYYNASIIFIVGPEGGWTPEETRRFENAGYEKVHLGSRIMRADTAGLALAAIIQYERGDFSS